MALNRYCKILFKSTLIVLLLCTLLCMIDACSTIGIYKRHVLGFCGNTPTVFEFHAPVFSSGYKFCLEFPTSSLPIMELENLSGEYSIQSIDHPARIHYAAEISGQTLTPTEVYNGNMRAIAADLLPMPDLRPGHYCIMVITSNAPPETTACVSYIIARKVFSDSLRKNF